MGKLAVKKLAYFISILFTFLILFLSIIANYSGTIDPNDNISAAYFTFSSPIFVFINLILLLYWAIRWRYWFIIPLLGLLSLNNYITSMYQLYSSTKYSSDSKLTLVTYNVHSFGNEVTGYSAKEFAKLMNKDDVDVICFQEYLGNGDFTINDIFDTFSKYYPYSYISTSPSLAIYSKYPISDGQSIPFKQSNSGAVWADIDIKGMKIRVISVHMQTTSFDRMRAKIAKAEEANNSDEKQNILEQYYSNSLNNNIRKRADQAKQIAELVNSTNTPVLLCGDFNDIPNSYTYNTLKGYLKDGFKSAGKGFAHTYKGLYNIMRIDYIFYGDAFSPIRYETIPFDMSDHNPVLMEVGF